MSRLYPKMKDSGVEWLGKMPEHWDLSRADSRIGTSRNVVNPEQLKDKTVFHYSIPVVQEIGDGLVEEGSGIDSSKLVIDRKQVLVSKLNPRKGTVCVAEPKNLLTVCSGEFVPIIPKDADLKYLYYVVQSGNYRMRLESLVESATKSHQRALPEDVLKFYWGWPSINEQIAIASFLDRKTALIDDLIAKRERQIELLQEQRMALISRVVTKGLNPDVAMKDSGVEWLGEIPKNWDVNRLKFITPEVTVGIVVTPAKYYVDEGVPCLRSLNVREGKLLDSDLVFISPESNVLHSKSMIYTEDLVAVRTGQPGTTAIVDERFDGANCIDLIIIRRSGKYFSPFLEYQCNSALAKMQFGIGAGGAIQQHFNIETAKNLLVVCPPYHEQKTIVDFLHRGTKRIDAMIETYQRQIEKLREYRQSLISATVTGKIDVREWANRKISEEEAKEVYS